MTASWPVELGPALHATLMRRCPPPRSGRELEPLCCALTDALEAGELTIQLTDEQQALVIASGWLEQANCPLRLEGQRIGWRRWVDAKARRGRRGGRQLSHIAGATPDGV